MNRHDVWRPGYAVLIDPDGNELCPKVSGFVVTSTIEDIITVTFDGMPLTGFTKAIDNGLVRIETEKFRLDVPFRHILNPASTVTLPKPPKEHR